MSEDISGYSVLKTDSRDSEMGEWRETALVGPENIKNQKRDLHAFSLSPEEELFLDLVPSSVVNMLKDTSSWLNRFSAVGDIEKILKQTPSSPLSKDDLRSVVNLILISMSDSQSKVSQKGLQVMEYLVTLVRERIVPYLASLTLKILLKMGSNKGHLKKAGMSLFKALMEAVGPMPVLSELMKTGLRYKTSRVREESVNVIISAHIYYVNGETQVLPIAKELIPCLADSKAKVRQASFEAMALIATRLSDVELAQVVTVIAANHTSRSRHKDNNGLSIIDAFQSRLGRGSVPKLNEHSLVQYSVPVLYNSSEYTGADVDWIRAGGNGSNHSQLDSTSPPQQPSQNSLPGSGPPSTFRPYRSAGKRPWETENSLEVEVVCVCGGGGIQEKN